MGEFVTATGFVKKTLATLKAEYEALFQGVFGSDIDLDADGPFGQVIGLLAQRDADLFDGMEEIYTSRNPGEATGKSLDDISAETGVARLDATKTRASNVLLAGTDGTVVAAGKQAKQANNSLLYSLVTGVTIQLITSLKVKLEPNTAFPLAGGEVFTVTIDAVPYTYNGIALDTKKIVIDALEALITAGAWAGTASNENDDFLVLDGEDSDADTIPDTSFICAYTGTFDLEYLASGGTFDADETGVNTLPATTLNTIATPVAGWDSVTNPAAGVTGTAVETDAALRIRRALTFLAGAATDEAIRSAILNEVTAIQSVSVISNREWKGSTQKVVYDADFVAGNLIDMDVNGIAITQVPFNATHAQTMTDLRTQILTDIAGSTVVIDTLDTNGRTLIITTTAGITDIFTVVTGGASQAVGDVTYCDTNGIPAKAFEAVCVGGNAQDIIDTIWETMPSGIQSYGSTVGTAIDSEGNSQSVSFSRPSSQYIHVKVTKTLYTEEDYPTNGDDAIKDAIVAWSLIEYNPGKDVIRQRLNIPIYEVPGIQQITVEIDATDLPGDPPAWGTPNSIVMNSRQIAVFDTSRITVV
jgi:uncharacterized phage protein gp47/JayE